MKAYGVRLAAREAGFFRRMMGMTPVANEHNKGSDDAMVKGLGLSGADPAGAPAAKAALAGYSLPMSPNTGAYYTGTKAFASQPVVQVDKAGGSGADGQVHQWPDALVNGVRCHDVKLTIDLGKVVSLSYRAVHNGPINTIDPGTIKEIHLKVPKKKMPVPSFAGKWAYKPVSDEDLAAVTFTLKGQPPYTAGVSPAACDDEMVSGYTAVPAGYAPPTIQHEDAAPDGLDDVLAKIHEPGGLMALFDKPKPFPEPKAPPVAPPLRRGYIWDEEIDDDGDD